MRTRLAGAFACVMAASAAIGGIAHCSAVTELVVVVDTDLAAGTEVDEIDVTVDDGAGFTAKRTARVGGSDALPLSLGVTAGDDANKPVTVRAVARLRGVEVASAGLRTNLVEGESKLAHVSICRSCGTTCATVEAAGATLPAWSGSAPSAAVCSGVNDGDGGGLDSGRDASIDAPVDALDADSATDGGVPLVLAYWDFDEEAGGPVVFDRSGNQRDIGFTGSTVKRAPGKIGNGLQFSRTDAGTGTGSLSCEAWKAELFGASGALSFWWRDEDPAPASTIPSSVGVFSTQSSGRDHFFVSRFRQDPPQRFTLGFQFKDLDATAVDDYANDDGGGPTKLDVVQSTWTRILVTWTPNGATLRNGKDALPIALPFKRPWTATDQSCFFGSNAVGVLDEVRVFSRPLNDAEIAALP
jgi:hypothetical protein